ncbi:hypothetical protein EYF80_006341 [Liparis tanakae]|uniref:Uncharacterized protein n=1 Tax=Liparis tanakae TaxID=230148 RepID=A0A4Z2IZF0_9TELE|nr:hypothetical protein EYF80_006341 [Liparis tanakae]
MHTVRAYISGRLFFTLAYMSVILWWSDVRVDSTLPRCSVSLRGPGFPSSTLFTRDNTCFSRVTARNRTDPDLTGGEAPRSRQLWLLPFRLTGTTPLETRSVCRWAAGSMIQAEKGNEFSRSCITLLPPSEEKVPLYVGSDFQRRRSSAVDVVFGLRTSSDPT